jgi:hypothetical protein
MAKLNYEHVYAGAGFSGETFDVCQGPADTGIIDVLLSAGNGALTEDAPHVLISTGAVGAAADLDLKKMEFESAGKGGAALNGRFFFLSVQNSDIDTNPITIKTSTVGGTINGTAGATGITIDTTGDYLFHHQSAGKWRMNVLPTPAEALATIARVDFINTDWDAGATKNQIVIKQTGGGGGGEAALPHGLTIASSYVVQILNTTQSPAEQVDVEIAFAANGDITLKKAPKGGDFSGTAIIVGSLD